MSLTRHQPVAVERPRADLRFSSIANAATDPHINGQYLKKNPSWHVEFSEDKADAIHRLLQRRDLQPQRIGEVGCGAGEVLRQLQLRLPRHCKFHGYDIAPHAIDLAQSRANDRLQFELGDFGQIETPHFDLLLVLEVVDHIEDYLGFLRMAKARGDWKLFSFSLDISAQNALRKGALLRRRRDHCHLHHFSSETALASLAHTGYEVVEYSFRPALAMTPIAKLAKPFRRMAFMLGQEFTLRMFGGYSLLVLAR